MTDWFGVLFPLKGTSWINRQLLALGSFSFFPLRSNLLGWAPCLVMALPPCLSDSVHF